MMKKWICFVLMTAILVTFCACGTQNAPEEETPAVGMPNPWRDCTLDEALEHVAVPFRAPEGSESESWRLMESSGGDLAELRFTWDGLDFTARAKKTEAPEDISGMYYSWNEEVSFTLQNGAEGTLYRLAGEAQTNELCLWYDRQAGASCSLSVSAADLDGFDLIAAAEAMTWEQLPPDTRPVPSAQTLADEYFRVVGAYHMGTAGSSLAKAKAACDVVSFAAGQKLSGAHIPSLRQNLLQAWESLSEDERTYFDENFLDLVLYIQTCTTDWEQNRGIFEDAGVAEEMEKLLNDPDAMESWNVLQSHTVTLGNSEG